MEPQRGCIMRRTYPPTHHRLTFLLYSESGGSRRCMGNVWNVFLSVRKVSGYVWKVSVIFYRRFLKVSEGFPNIFSFNIVRCPHPNCFPINKVCVVSPLPVYVFSMQCPHHPPYSSVSLLPLALFWILSTDTWTQFDYRSSSTCVF